MRGDDTICALPWTNLNTTPLGQCKLCCNISDFKVLYASTDQTSGRSKRAVGWGRDHIREIWNGSHMRRVRESMLEGRRVEDCKGCYDLEDLGSDSPRLAANRQYLETISKPMTLTACDLPRSLELRLSTRCNLRCATCWSGSSDTVARHRQNRLGDPHMPGWLRTEWDNDIGINLRGEQNFDSDGDYASTRISLDNFALMAQTLQRLYITGGEPTMDANIYRYLDMLMRHDNRSCHISWTTNGTLWNQKLMDQLGHFPNNEIQISIDAYAEANEFIRRPSQWHVVCDVFARYLSQPTVQAVKVFTVISALNVTELLPLLGWLRDTINLHGRQCTWYPIILQNPRWLSATVLPAHDLAVVVRALQSWATETEMGCFDAIGGITQLCNSLRHRTDDDIGCTRLLQWLEYDTSGVRPWREVLPGLASIINEVGYAR